MEEGGNTIDKTIIPVEKNSIIIQKKRMRKYLYMANSIHEGVSKRNLEEAYRTLSIAKGVYYTLHNLGLAEEDNLSAEDIDRIENKINYILEGKHKKRRLK